MNEYEGVATAVRNLGTDYAAIARYLYNRMCDVHHDHQQVSEALMETALRSVAWRPPEKARATPEGGEG